MFDVCVSVLGRGYLLHAVNPCHSEKEFVTYVICALHVFLYFVLWVFLLSFFCFFLSAFLSIFSFFPSFCTPSLSFCSLFPFASQHDPGREGGQAAREAAGEDCRIREEEGGDRGILQVVTVEFCNFAVKFSVTICCVLIFSLYLSLSHTHLSESVKWAKKRKYVMDGQNEKKKQQKMQ